MPSAEKLILAALILAFPVAFPFTLARFSAERFTEPRKKFRFIATVAVISYCVAIAVAFLISTILRTYAPYIVTGHEAVAPAFNFLSNYEFAITICVLILGTIGMSAFLLVKLQKEES